MPDYLIGTGLPAQPAGLEDKDFRLVNPLYGAVSALARQLSEEAGAVKFSQSELGQRNQAASLGAQSHRKVYALFPNAIGYGKLVNLFVSAGKLSAQLADNTLGLPAHGIVNNFAGAAANSYAEVVIVEGFSAGITGATLGQFYYLSTGGLVVNTPPGVGFIQSVGFGLGSLGFYLHIENISLGGGGGIGPPGPPGPSGSNGINGVSFWAPQDEAEEALVIPGPPGPQGATGPAGAAGTNGTNGAPGAPGATGATGPQGQPVWAQLDESGDDYQIPIPGAQGPQGLQGPAGVAGSNGAPGTPGRDGQTNWLFTDDHDDQVVVPGPPGPVGPAGTNGVPGTAGAKGDTGPAIWVPWDDHDDVGFIAGPKGDKGDIGATGPQGPAGSGGSGSAAPMIWLPSDEFSEDYTPQYHGTPDGISREKLNPDARGWRFLGTASNAANAVTVGPVIWTGTYRQLMFQYLITGYSGGTPVGRVLIGAASISTTGLTNGNKLISDVTANATSVSVPGCPLAVTLSSIARSGYGFIQGASGALKQGYIKGINGNPAAGTSPTSFLANFFFSDLGTNLPIQRMQLTVYDTLIATAVSANLFTAGTTLWVWGRNND